jgi:hypothetical protein
LGSVSLRATCVNFTFSFSPSVPFAYFRRGSETRVIEEQIAQRERRLAELE